MKKTEGTVCAVLSDFHCPFEDKAAVSVALDLLADIQPNIVILGGDVVDFAPLSRFTKSPYDVLTLQDDLNQTKKLLQTVRTTVPKATLIYLSGNHEDRLETYLNTTPALFPLDCLKIENLLSLNDLDCAYVRDGKPFQWHAWNIVHGDVVRQNSGATAQAMITKYGSSGWNGHTHRLGLVHKRNHSHSYTWVEGGCLSRLDAPYLSVADWANGMTVLTCKDGEVYPEPVSISKGKAFYRGKIYEAEAAEAV